MAILRDPIECGPYMGAWRNYARMLAEAGLLKGGAALQFPETAVTLRTEDGERLIQDGPFAETKEQLGGFFVIEVAGRDAALDWASRCPIAPGGVIEIRPTVPQSAEGG